MMKSQEEEEEEEETMEGEELGVVSTVVDVDLQLFQLLDVVFFFDQQEPQEPQEEYSLIFKMNYYSFGFIWLIFQLLLQIIIWIFHPFPEYYPPDATPPRRRRRRRRWMNA